MELIIVRHGQTVANTRNWYYGFTDSPVTDKGRKQARAAGLLIEGLKFSPDVIYLSERTRTHETLQHMGFDTQSAIIDARLNEQHMGAFECMTYQEIQASYPTAFDEWNRDFNHFKPPGGESHMDLNLRVRSFLDELVEEERGRGRRILVIAHGGVMHSAYAYINRNRMDTYYSVYFDNVAMLRSKYLNDRLVMDALYNPAELVSAFDLKSGGPEGPKS